MNNMEGRFAAVQSQGKRDYQEDEYGLLVSEDSSQGFQTVIVVADGMGGHAHGAKASRLVTEVFIDTIQEQPQDTIEQRLQNALETANNTITSAVEEEPALEGMGSTLVALLQQENNLHWISVGDSPMWVFRHSSLSRLNADHSMAPVLQKMVEDGKLTAEEAATDKRRHALFSAITGESIDQLDLRDDPFIIQENDLFLLASDGILTLSEKAIEDSLRSTDAEAINIRVEALLQAVETCQQPRQDNITIAAFVPLPGQTEKAEPTTVPATPNITEETTVPNIDTKETAHKKPTRWIYLAMIAIVFIIAIFMLI